MASKTTPAPVAPVDEWAVLFEAAEYEEVRDTGPVDVSGSVVDFLTSLRKPGPNGGKQRVRLPLNGKTYQETVRILRAGAKLIDPPSSASCKPIFNDEDEVIVVREGKSKVEIREGAEPIGVTVSVGEKRGAKSSAGNDNNAESGEA